jgi:hypothetical protein
MQCTQFCAKSAKYNLKPTQFFKRNFMLKWMEYVIRVDNIQRMGLQKNPLGGDGLKCDHAPIQCCRCQTIF